MEICHARYSMLRLTTLILAAFCASSSMADEAKPAPDLDPFIATSGAEIDPIYIALGLAFLAIAVASASGTD
ncbi:hypothetical protein [Pseudaestuariivita sp.]|uniref:hypothetical protein n=1 Tax=Pseudaestuariivita sp. TaxID=2211669 RepID=UPI004059109E